MIRVADTPDPTETAAPPALAVCRSAHAAGPWWGAPAEDEAADVYFARLVDSDRLDEASRFAAAWLGPRGAVWWGALCVWNELRDVEPEEAADRLAAIDAAVAWVLEPSDERRRAANSLGHAVGLDTAAGVLATAVFWSGGSVSLPEQPAVDPPPGMNAKLVAGAVLRAAAAPSDAARRATLRQSLRMAAELLAGGTPWPADAAEGAEDGR